ncbi:MAG: DUF3147 family protein [Acidobacteriaceae bacterium]|nr:DUF3147 family protein [Acidobacteriaceae bacterium]
MGIVGVESSALHGGRWREYLVRFVFGGLITAATGLIAKKWGPAVAGLFLAFPAIFPAGATLIEKHEKEKKKKAGLDGTARGRAAASVDAAGAAMGSIGLMVFGVVVWRFLPSHASWAVLTIAGVAWMGVSVLLWWVRKVVW